MLILCGVIVSSSLPARSIAADEATSGVELDWRAPAGCPDRAAVQRSLARLLTNADPHAKEDTGAASRHLLRADARVEPSGDTDAVWTLTLRTNLDGVAGERVIHGRGCVALTDAAVLTLALMLNPDIDVDRAAPTHKKSAPATSSDDSRSTVHLEASLPFRTLGRDRVTTPLGLRLSTHVGLAAGILPKLGPELGIGVGVTMGRVSLTLNGDWGPVQRATLPSSANMGGKLWSGSLTLFGCWSFRSQAFSAGPCVGASITRLEGDGFGIAHPQTAVVYFVSPLAAAHLDWRIYTHFALRLLVMGLVPIDRPRIFVDDLGDVHHPASVNGRAQIGAVMHLR